LQPQSWEWRAKRAAALRDIGRYRDAMDDHNATLLLNPDPPAAVWRSIAKTHIALEQRGDAIDAYRKAIERAPSDWRLREECGRLEMRTGDWKLAAADLAKALELKPDNSWVIGLRRDLATCHAELADWKTAAEEFEKCAALSHALADSHEAALAWLAGKDAKFDAVREQLFKEMRDKELNTLEDHYAVLGLFGLTADGPKKRGGAQIQAKKQFDNATTPEQRDRLYAEVYLYFLRAKADQSTAKEAAAETLKLLANYRTAADSAWEGLFDAVRGLAHQFAGDTKEADAHCRRAQEWLKERQRQNRPVPWQARLQIQLVIDEVYRPKKN
jgi:hypothetical protein